MLAIKRAYEPYNRHDGQRILTDRLWPRGVTKEKAHVDLWLKGIAPSTELRKWFSHDPSKWSEFQKRYKLELSNNTEGIKILRDSLKSGPVTLIYSAKDEVHNDAVVLKAYLEE